MAQLQLREQRGENGIKSWKHRADVGGAEAQTCGEGCCEADAGALCLVSGPHPKEEALAGWRVWTEGLWLNNHKREQEAVQPYARMVLL